MNSKSLYLKRYSFIKKLADAIIDAYYQYLPDEMYTEIHYLYAAQDLVGHDDVIDSDDLYNELLATIQDIVNNPYYSEPSELYKAFKSGNKKILLKAYYETLERYDSRYYNR